MRKFSKIIAKTSLVIMLLLFVGLILEVSTKPKAELEINRNELSFDNATEVQRTNLASTNATSSQLSQIGIASVSYAVNINNSQLTYIDTNQASRPITVTSNINVYRFNGENTSENKTFYFYRYATELNQSALSNWQIAVISYGSGQPVGPVNGRNQTQLNYAGCFPITGVDLQIAQGIITVDSSGYVQISHAGVSYYISQSKDITSAKPSTPTFANYTISAQSSNTNQGTVSGGVTGTSGVSTTLIATAKTGYQFSYWLKGGTNSRITTNPLIVSVESSDVTYTAYFTAINYSVSASAMLYNTNTAGGGIVSGAGSYTFGSSVTLSATAYPGYEFVGWYKGTLRVSLNSKYVFTKTAENEMYVARFSPIKYSLNVYLTGLESPSNLVMNCVYGQTVTLNIAPQEGHTLSNYTLTNASSTAQYTTNNTTWNYVTNNTIPANAIGLRNVQSTQGATANLYANYKINYYEKAVINTTTDFGSTHILYNGSTASNTSIKYKDSYTLNATCNSGYEFVGWYTSRACTGTPVSTSTSYTTTSAASNEIFYAKFKQKGIHVSSSYSNSEENQTFNNLKAAIDFATRNNITDIFIQGQIGSLYENYNIFVNQAGNYISYTSKNKIKITGIGSNNIIYNNAANCLINVAAGEVAFENVTFYGTGESQIAGNQDNALLRVSGGTLTLINTTVTNNYNVGSGIHYAGDWCPGVIDVYQGELILNNSRLYGNTTTYGGDIFVHGGRVTMTGSTIEGSVSSGIYAINDSEISLDNSFCNSIYLSADASFDAKNILKSISLYKENAMNVGSIIGNVDASSASYFTGQADVSLIGAHQNGSLIWNQHTPSKSMLQLAIESANSDKAFTITEGETVHLASVLGKYVYHLNGCLYIGRVSADSSYASVVGTGKRAIITGNKVGTLNVTLMDVSTRGCYYYGTTSISSIVIQITVLPKIGNVVAGKDTISITNCNANSIYKLYDKQGNLVATTAPSYDSQTQEYYVRFEKNITELSQYTIEASHDAEDGKTYTSNQKVVTSNKSSLQLAIENASGFYMDLGQTMSLSDILGNSVYHLRYCVNISNVSAITNPEYVILSSNNKNANITANTVGYVDLSLSARTNEWCAVYGTVSSNIDNIKIRLYILPALQDNEVSVSTNSITLPSKPEYSYSMDGVNWISSGTFSNLNQNSSYNILIRYSYIEDGYSSTLMGNYSFKTALDRTNSTTISTGVQSKIEDAKKIIQDLELSEDTYNRIESILDKLHTKVSSNLSIDELDKINNAIDFLINVATSSSNLDVSSDDSNSITAKIEDYLSKLDELTLDELISRGLNIIENNKDFVEHVHTISKQIQAISPASSIERFEESIKSYESLSPEEKDSLQDEIAKVLNLYKDKITAEINKLNYLSLEQAASYKAKIEEIFSNQMTDIEKIHEIYAEYQKSLAHDKLNEMSSTYTTPSTFEETIESLSQITYESVEQLDDIVQDGLIKIYEAHIQKVSTQMSTATPSSYAYTHITNTSDGYTYNSIKYETYIDAYKAAILDDEKNVVTQRLQELFEQYIDQLKTKTALEVKNNSTDFNTILEELISNLRVQLDAYKNEILVQSSADSLFDFEQKTKSFIEIENLKAIAIEEVLVNTKNQIEKNAQYNPSLTDEELTIKIISSLNNEIENKKQEIIDNIISSTTSSAIENNKNVLQTEINKNNIKHEYVDTIIDSYNSKNSKSINLQITDELTKEMENGIESILVCTTTQESNQVKTSTLNKLDNIDQKNSAIVELTKYKNDLSKNVNTEFASYLDEFLSSSIQEIINLDSTIVTTNQINSIVSSSKASMELIVQGYQAYVDISGYAENVINNVLVLDTLGSTVKDAFVDELRQIVSSNSSALKKPLSSSEIVSKKKKIYRDLDDVYAKALELNTLQKDSMDRLDEINFTFPLDESYTIALNEIIIEAKNQVVACTTAAEMNTIISLVEDKALKLEELAENIKDSITSAREVGFDTRYIQIVQDKAVDSIIYNESYDYASDITNMLDYHKDFTECKAAISKLDVANDYTSKIEEFYNEGLTALVDGTKEYASIKAELKNITDAYLAIATIEDNAKAEIKAFVLLPEGSVSKYKAQIEVQAEFAVASLENAEASTVIEGLTAKVNAIVEEAGKENTSLDTLTPQKNAANEYISKLEEFYTEEAKPEGWDAKKEELQNAATIEEVENIVKDLEVLISISYKQSCDALYIALIQEAINLLSTDANKVTVDAYTAILNEYNTNSSTYTLEKFKEMYQKLTAIEEFYTLANTNGTEIYIQIKDNLVNTIATNNGQINTRVDLEIQKGLTATIENDLDKLTATKNELVQWKSLLDNSNIGGTNLPAQFVDALITYVFEQSMSLEEVNEKIIADLGNVDTYLNTVRAHEGFLSNEETAAVIQSIQQIAPTSATISSSIDAYSSIYLKFIELGMLVITDSTDFVEITNKPASISSAMNAILLSLENQDGSLSMTKVEVQGYIAEAKAALAEEGYKKAAYMQDKSFVAAIQGATGEEYNVKIIATIKRYLELKAQQTALNDKTEEFSSELDSFVQSFENENLNSSFDVIKTISDKLTEAKTSSVYSEVNSIIDELRRYVNSNEVLNDLIDCLSTEVSDIKIKQTIETNIKSLYTQDNSLNKYKEALSYISNGIKMDEYLALYTSSVEATIENSNGYSSDYIYGFMNDERLTKIKNSISELRDALIMASSNNLTDIYTSYCNELITEELNLEREYAIQSIQEYKSSLNSLVEADLSSINLQQNHESILNEYNQIIKVLKIRNEAIEVSKSMINSAINLGVNQEIASSLETKYITDINEQTEKTAIDVITQNLDLVLQIEVYKANAMSALNTLKEQFPSYVECSIFITAENIIAGAQNLNDMQQAVESAKNKLVKIDTEVQPIVSAIEKILGKDSILMDNLIEKINQNIDTNILTETLNGINLTNVDDNVIAYITEELSSSFIGTNQLIQKTIEAIVMPKFTVNTTYQEVLEYLDSLDLELKSIMYRQEGIAQIEALENLTQIEKTDYSVQIEALANDSSLEKNVSSIVQAAIQKNEEAGSFDINSYIDSHIEALDKSFITSDIISADEYAIFINKHSAILEGFKDTAKDSKAYAEVDTYYKEAKNEYDRLVEEYYSLVEKYTDFNATKENVMSDLLDSITAIEENYPDNYFTDIKTEIEGITNITSVDELDIKALEINDLISEAIEAYEEYQNQILDAKSEIIFAQNAAIQAVEALDNMSSSIKNQYKDKISLEAKVSIEMLDSCASKIEVINLVKATKDSIESILDESIEFDGIYKQIYDKAHSVLSDDALDVLYNSIFNNSSYTGIDKTTYKQALSEILEDKYNQLLQAEDILTLKEINTSLDSEIEELQNVANRVHDAIYSTDDGIMKNIDAAKTALDSHNTSDEYKEQTLKELDLYLVEMGSVTDFTLVVQKHDEIQSNLEDLLNAIKTYELTEERQREQGYLENNIAATKTQIQNLPTYKEYQEYYDQLIEHLPTNVKSILDAAIDVEDLNEKVTSLEQKIQHTLKSALQMDEMLEEFKTIQSDIDSIGLISEVENNIKTALNDIIQSSASERLDQIHAKYHENIKDILQKLLDSELNPENKNSMIHTAKNTDDIGIALEKINLILTVFEKVFAVDKTSEITSGINGILDYVVANISTATLADDMIILQGLINQEIFDVYSSESVKTTLENSIQALKDQFESFINSKEYQNDAEGGKTQISDLKDSIHVYTTFCEEFVLDAQDYNDLVVEIIISEAYTLQDELSTVLKDNSLDRANELVDYALTISELYVKSIDTSKYLKNEILKSTIFEVEEEILILVAELLIEEDTKDLSKYSDKNSLDVEIYKALVEEYNATFNENLDVNKYELYALSEITSNLEDVYKEILDQAKNNPQGTLDTIEQTLNNFNSFVVKYEEFAGDKSYVQNLTEDLEKIIQNEAKEAANGIIADIDTSNEYSVYEYANLIYKEYNESIQYDRLIQSKLIDEINGMVDLIETSGVYYLEQIANAKAYLDEFIQSLNNPLSYVSLSALYWDCVNNLNSIPTACESFINELEEELESMQGNQQYNEETLEIAKEIVDSMIASLDEKMPTTKVDQFKADTLKQLEELPIYKNIVLDSLDELYISILDEKQYFKEEEEIIKQYIEQAKSDMDIIYTVTAMDEYILDLNAKIDELPTAIKVASKELMEYKDSLSDELYTLISMNKIHGIINTAIIELEKCPTRDEVQIIKTEALDSSSKVETIEEQSYTKVKAEAIDALKEYKSDQYDDINIKIDAYIEEIKALKPQYSTKEDIINTLNIQMEDIIKSYQEEILKDIDVINDSIILNDYKEEQAIEIEILINDSKDRTNSSTSILELKKIISDLNTAIKTLPTKVEVAQKEALESLDTKYDEIIHKDYTQIGVELTDATKDKIKGISEQLKTEINGQALEEIKEQINQAIASLDQQAQEVIYQQAADEINSRIDSYLEGDYLDGASTKAEIEDLISKYPADKSDLNTEAFELQNKKNEVATQLDAKYNELDLNEYSSFNQDKLAQIADEAMNQIYSASTQEEVTEIFNQAIEDLLNVATLQEEAVEGAKKNAIEYLEQFKDGTDTINSFVEQQKDIISNLPSESTAIEVEFALKDAIQDIYNEKLNALEDGLNDSTLDQIFDNAHTRLDALEEQKDLEELFESVIATIEQRKSALDSLDAYTKSELTDEAIAIIEQAKAEIYTKLDESAIIDTFIKYVDLLDKQILKDAIASAIEKIKSAYATYDETQYTLDNYVAITAYKDEAIQQITGSISLAEVARAKDTYLDLMAGVPTVIETAIEKLKNSASQSDSDEMTDIYGKWEDVLNTLTPNEEGKYAYNDEVYDTITEAINKALEDANNEIAYQLNDEAVQKAIEEIKAYKDAKLAYNCFSLTGVAQMNIIFEDAKGKLEELDLASNNLASEILSITNEAKRDIDAVLADFRTTEDGQIGKDTNVSDYPEGYDYSAGLWGNVTASGDALSVETSLVVEKQDQTYVELASEVFEENKLNYTSNVNLEKSEVKELLDVYLLQNNKRVHLNGTQIVYTVRILIPEEYRNVRELSIVHIKDDGALELYTAIMAGNFLIFETAHFSDYALIGMTHTEQVREESLEETNAYFDQIDSAIFNHEQWAEIRDIYNETISKLEGQTISASEMTQIVLEFITRMDEYPTAVDAKKGEALLELKEEFLRYDEKDYTKSQYEAIVASYEAAKRQINESTSIEQINTILQNTKEEMAKPKTTAFIVWMVILCVLGLILFFFLLLFVFYFRITIYDEDEELMHKRSFVGFKVKSEKLNVSKEGYTLIGIYTDKQLNKILDEFRMPFGRIKLYTKWELNDQGIRLGLNRDESEENSFSNIETDLLKDESRKIHASIVATESKSIHASAGIDKLAGINAEDNDLEDDTNVILKDYNPLVSYSISLDAKLALGSDELNSYYNEIKNKILSYDVKSRCSFKKEAFVKGRKPLVLLAVRGKTLNAYIALDLEHCKSVHARAYEANTRYAKEHGLTLVKVSSDLQLKKILGLIDDVMNENEIKSKQDYKTQDYTKELRGYTYDQLLEMGKIKVFRKRMMQSVSASDVNQIMSDELLNTIVISKEKRKGINGKKAILNLDTLQKVFKEGSIVDIEAMKKNKLIDKNVGHIKILARGSIDKSLTIKANAFSKEAMKMILLTGGEVILLENE